MSECDSLLKAGDLGQRYEVRAVGMQGREFVVGWTPHADGGGLSRVIEKHPVWKLSQIVDRHAPPVIAEKRGEP